MMKISILGTGMVGQALAGKISSLENEVYMGTRNAEETLARKESNSRTGVSFADWHSSNSKVKVLKFDQLPANSDLFINATNGHGSIEALRAVGKEKLKGKTLLDVSNPLDFSNGMPPSLFVCNTDSLAEQIQREFPDSYVVKSLNTMNCNLMVNPSLVPGSHTVFVSGNDDNAKSEVKALLVAFGWKNTQIIDLGDITSARGAEMVLPLWIRLMNLFGSAEFNFNIVKK